MDGCCCCHRNDGLLRMAGLGNKRGLLLAKQLGPFVLSKSVTWKVLVPAAHLIKFKPNFNFGAHRSKYLQLRGPQRPFLCIKPQSILLQPLWEDMLETRQVPPTPEPAGTQWKWSRSKARGSQSVHSSVCSLWPWWAFQEGAVPARGCSSLLLEQGRAPALCPRGSALPGRVPALAGAQLWPVYGGAASLLKHKPPPGNAQLSCAGDGLW